jgi:hypothetical protein
MDSMINLAVAGLIIPSTSAIKTGAFSSECPGIPMARKKRERTKTEAYFLKR